MPTRGYGYGPPPSMRDYGRGAEQYDDPYYRGGGSPVTQILMESGRQQAQSELANADIWGNAIDKIGQQLGAGFKGLGEHLQAEDVKKDEKAKATRQQEMENERNQTLNKLMEEKKGALMPQDFIGIYGLERGMKLAQAWGELSNKEKKADIGKIMVGFDAADEKTKAQTWPVARQRIDEDNPGAGQFMPETWEGGGKDYWEKIKKDHLPKPELMEVDAGKTVIDKSNPAGGALYTAPEKPTLKSPSFKDVETAGGIRAFNQGTGEMGPVLASLPPKGAPGHPPNPNANQEGDDAADAWAAGMAFPSTQAATTAAIASFRRRGMPVPRKLTAMMQQDSVRQGESIQQIEDVGNMFNKVKAKLGPGTYQFKEIAQRLPGFASDPDFAEFNAALRFMQNMEIKRVTGAQMSEGEATRLLKAMATGDIKNDEFERVIRIMHRNAKRSRDLLLYGPSKAKEAPRTPAGTTPIPPGGPRGPGQTQPRIEPLTSRSGGGGDGWSDAGGGFRVREKR